jgi:hypothetical protein
VSDLVDEPRKVHEGRRAGNREHNYIPSTSEAAPALLIRFAAMP